MLTKKQKRVISAFTAVSRPMIRQFYGGGLCIASTPIAIEPLANYGISAKAQAVATKCGDRRVRVCWLSSKHREMPPCGKFARRPKSAGRMDVIGDIPTPTLWSGHLVAVVQGEILIDAAIDQVNQPASGLIYPAVLVAHCRKLAVNKPLVVRARGDCWVRYRLALGPDESYRDSISMARAPLRTSARRPHCPSRRSAPARRQGRSRG